MSGEAKKFIIELCENFKVIQRLNNWGLEFIEDDILIFTLPARDGEIYRIIILCDGYPSEAPSVKFVNHENDPTDSTAWPDGDALFLKIVKPPPHCFLCMPLTKEGLSHHKEWLTDSNIESWCGDKHTILDILNFCKRWLESPHYKGRKGS